MEYKSYKNLGKMISHSMQCTIDVAHADEYPEIDNSSIPKQNIFMQSV